MAGSYDYGIPSVDPTSTAPSDYQSIPSNPNAFGAGVARAQVGLGQSLIAGGAAVGKIGDYYDDVAADHALNQYQDRARKLLHGDPDDKAPGPDGQMQAKPGFLALQGEQAMRARPEIEKSLDALQKDLSSGLKNPRAQEKFSRSVTGYRDTASAQIGSHTDGQALNWYTQVNKAREVNGFTAIATNPDDMDIVLHSTSDVLGARIQNLQLHGLDTPATRAEAEAATRRDALATQTEAIAVKDPARAMSILDKNRTIAGTKYDELATKFRTRANQQDADTLADTALANGALGASPMIPPGTAKTLDSTAPSNTGTNTQLATEHDPNLRAMSTKLASAIVQQESGGNPNAPTSSAGAEGIGQIMPATFRRYAKPGEDIKVPADNAAVSQRVIDDYTAKYKGDPRRVAVAYYSGEGNVAPPGSPTPWIKDVASNGKPVSSYVADVTKRIGYTTDNLSAADQALKLTPQEKALYERHLGNVAGAGGVTHADGSRSTLFATTAEIDGKTYVIPTVWDGKIVPPKEAIDKAVQGGIDQFPAYASRGEAEARYGKMHEFMEQDVVQADHGPEAVQGRIATVRANALQAIINNKDISPEVRSLAINRVEQVARAQTVAAEQDARAKKLANDAAADVYVKNLLKPGPIDPNVLTQIRDDPHLDHATRQGLGNAVMARSGSDVDKAKQDYGSGFWDAYKSVTAAPGTPGRITDLSQVLNRAGPGGDLTLLGVDRLRQTMGELQKPENSALVAMRQGALAYAKNQLSFEMEIGNFKLADPQGQDDFNSKFIPAFYNAFDAGIQAGKTPAQLLTKEYAGHKQNPDYIVDDLISAYKRTPAQLTAARINAFNGAVDSGGKPKPEIDTSTPDKLKEAVGKGSLTMEEGLKIGQDKGWIRKTSAETPTPPTR